MNVASLTAAQMNFTPIGDDTGAPDRVLHGQLNLAGCLHHVTAVQVIAVGDGVLEAVDSEYADEVEALYDMAGGSLTPTEINGKHYLLMIFPHGV